MASKHPALAGMQMRPCIDHLGLGTQSKGILISGARKGLHVSSRLTSAVPLNPEFLWQRETRAAL